jgi:beta-lactamase regulating signal transducer with metallopeptidase domain
MIVILKATIVFALALTCVALAKRAAASTRHLILVCAQFVALLLPLLMLYVPPVKFDAPPIVGAPASPPADAAASAPPLSLPPTDPASRPSWWLVGTLTMLASQSIAYLRARNIIRRARPSGPFLVSTEVDQPVTLGSHIVLPSEARSWPEHKLESVLLHERAHIARRDSLLAILGDLCLAVYWFHPLAWFIIRRAKLERERACDDAVLARGIAPETYATALLDVARSLGRRTPGLAMAARSHLSTRIHAILDPAQHPHATRTTRAIIVLCALATAPILAALTLRGGEPDLRGDFVASPFSERIPLPTHIPQVAASGPDAALIATMQQIAAHPPRSPIDFVSDRARWALTQVRNGELVLPLIDALHDRDWRVQAYAAFGLSVARDRRATPHLIALTNHPVWRVRAMVASALKSIADPAAAEAMKRMLDDDAWQVRHEAVRYFANIGGHDALIATKQNDRHMAVRAAVEEALP